MSIAIDDAKLHEIVTSTLGSGIRDSEIPAVIEAAQLAASIDLDDGDEEQTLLRVLIARLCAIAGVDATTIRPLSPVPTDPEERTARLAALRERLSSPGARELAYVLAYLLVVVDHELAPVEMDLLDAMQRELGIPKDRAAELVARTSGLVTPGVGGEPDRP
jgi:hypothetical protein